MKSAGSQLRSYCYSLDCATALLAILLSGESQNAYNISNPNSIITISREFGSGGRTIGQMLAKELNVEYYDKDLILREDNTVHARTFETKIGVTCRL